MGTIPITASAWSFYGPASRSLDHPTMPPSRAPVQNSLRTIANPSRRRLSCDRSRAYKLMVRLKKIHKK